jgi:hypothetical protein
MSEKKNRERVTAEITISHLMRLEGRASEMWKHMMQAAEEFIACSLARNSLSSGGHNGFASRARSVRSLGNTAQ